MRVMIAIPTLKALLPVSLTQFLMQAERFNHQPNYPHKFSFRFCENKAPCDYARNVLAGKFLNTDCEALWFVDDDMLPPKNAFDLLDEPGDIISPTTFIARFYQNRSQTENVGRHAFAVELNGYKRTDPAGEKFVNIDPSQQVGDSNRMEIDAVGTAAIIIKRHVLEDERMWLAPVSTWNREFDENTKETETCRDVPLLFKNQHNITGRTIRGHDVDFTNRATLLGYKLQYVLDNEWGHIKMLDIGSVMSSLASYVQNLGMSNDQDSDVKAPAFDLEEPAA